MKKEFLKPGDIIKIKDDLGGGEYSYIIANIDGTYRLIGLHDGEDFIEEYEYDLQGYTIEDLKKFLATWGWEDIKYYRGLEEFLNS